jgi:hypothetical protein
MEPITLLVLGAIGIYAFTRKKKGPAGPKIFTFTMEGLLDKEPSISVRSGDTIKVILPGLREQWTLDIVGGGGLTLDKMFALEVIGERGVVTYTLMVVGEDMPWNSLITFNLNQQPYVKLAVSYVP